MTILYIVRHALYDNGPRCVLFVQDTLETNTATDKIPDNIKAMFEEALTQYNELKRQNKSLLQNKNKIENLIDLQDPDRSCSLLFSKALMIYLNLFFHREELEAVAISFLFL